MAKAPVRDFEAERICSQCLGPLEAADGHYHEKMDAKWSDVVCCTCAGCGDTPVAKEPKATKEPARVEEEAVKESKPAIQQYTGGVDNGEALEAIVAAAKTLRKEKFSAADVTGQLHGRLEWQDVLRTMKESSRFERISSRSWRLVD